MKKEVLDKQVEVVDVCEDNCTIEETIEQWNALKNKYVKAYHVRHELYRAYYGQSGGYDTYLCLYRLENDEEEAEREEYERISNEEAEAERLAKRQAEEAERLAKREAEEATERAEYERLKEKYGELV